MPGTTRSCAAVITLLVALLPVIIPVVGCRDDESPARPSTAVDARLQALLTHAASSIAAGRYAEARESLALAAERDPEAPGVFITMGDLLMALERVAEADSAYRTAIRLDSEHPWAYLRLGNVMFKREQYREAVALFERQLDFNQDADVWHNVGSAYAMLNRADSAVSAFERALEQRSGHAPSMAGIAQVHERIGDVDAAATWFARAVETASDNLHYRKKLGLLQQQTGRHLESIQSLQVVREARPWDHETYYAIGRAYQALSETARARAYLARADALRKINTAIVSLERHATREAANPKRQTDLAEAYSRVARWDDALRAYERARVLLPDEPSILGRIGGVYLQKDEPETAVRLFEGALAEDSTSFELWASAAVAYADAGAPDRARVALERAARLRPDDPRLRRLKSMLSPATP